MVRTGGRWQKFQLLFFNLKRLNVYNSKNCDTHPRDPHTIKMDNTSIIRKVPCALPATDLPPPTYRHRSAFPPVSVRGRNHAARASLASFTRHDVCGAHTCSVVSRVEFAAWMGLGLPSFLLWTGEHSPRIFGWHRAQGGVVGCEGRVRDSRVLQGL